MIMIPTSRLICLRICANIALSTTAPAATCSRRLRARGFASTTPISTNVSDEPPQSQAPAINPAVAVPFPYAQAREPDDRPTDPLEESPISSLLGHSTLYDDVLKLNQMIERNRPAAKCFKFLADRLWPSMRQNGGQLPTLVKNSTLQALQHVIRAKARDPDAADLPSMLRISQALAACSLDMVQRLKMVLNALEYLAGKDRKADTMESVMQDLLDVWKHLSMQRVTFLDLGSQTAWNLPSTSNVLIRSDKTSRWSAFLAGMKSLFPGYTFPSYANSDADADADADAESAASLLGGAAVGTLAVLTARFSTLSPVVVDARPFLLSVLDLINRTVLKPGDVGSALNAYQGLKLLVLSKWPVERDPKVQRTDLVVYRTRAKRAYQARNSRDVEATWNEYAAEVRATSSPDREHLRQREGDFVDYFLWAACALRRLLLRDKILQFMQEFGLPTTTRTHTAMMTGFKAARNVEYVAQQWQLAVKAGVHLDVAIWTARISGLIECGRPLDGVAALREMMEAWLAAERAGLQERVAKPDVEIINGTVAGLLRLGRQDAARDVMMWGARQGIEANLITLNTLLGQVLDRGRVDEAQKIMQMMLHRLGLKPDVITFSILINHRLRQAAAAETADVQAEMIPVFFAEMAAANVQPTNLTYAGMLEALMDGDPRKLGADAAIDAVRDQMRRNNMAETPQILTILTKRELRREKPDLVMIRALNDRRDMPFLNHLDTTFWEHVMVVLARAAATPSEGQAALSEAFEIFGWLRGNDRRVTMWGMKELLSVLAGRGRNAEAKELVREAIKMEAQEYRGRDVGASMRRRRHGFWALASDMGLL